jgi:hypothetical protein
MLNPKMTCPMQTGNADILLDYCARALDAERTAMLESHMAHCRECNEMARGQAEIWAALDAFDAEPVSAGFDRKLYARIAESERVPAWERFWAPVREYLHGRPAWQPVLSVAAASAMVAVVLLVRADLAQPGPATESAVDARGVEQAERLLEDLEMLRLLEGPAPADSGAAGKESEAL